MGSLMDALCSAKGVLVTAAIGERVISTTAFKKPLVTEYEDYYELLDNSGNEIYFEKDYIEVDTEDNRDFVIKYGVVEYYITPI